jgi:hypothetical protein
MFKVLHMHRGFNSQDFSIDDVADSLSHFQLQTPIHPTFNEFGNGTANMTKDLEEAKVAFEQYFHQKCKGRQVLSLQRAQLRPVSCSPCTELDGIYDEEANLTRSIGSSRQRSPLSALPVLQTSRRNYNFDTASPISFQSPQEIASDHLMENILSTCMQKRTLLTKKNGKIQKSKKTSVCLRRGKGTLSLAVSPVSIPVTDDVTLVISATKL